MKRVKVNSLIYVQKLVIEYIDMAYDLTKNFTPHFLTFP